MMSIENNCHQTIRSKHQLAVKEEIRLLPTEMFCRYDRRVVQVYDIIHLRIKIEVQLKGKFVFLFIF